MLVAEQRTRNEWNDQALTRLREAHAVLRADYESTRSALEKVSLEHAESAQMLGELRDAHDQLARQHQAAAGGVTEGQARNESNLRAL